MAIQVSAICNKCKVIYPEFWVDLDEKGFPDYKKATCQECGSKGCLSREWSHQSVNAIIPIVEDGEINRFEYSYTNPNGKRITKKMDPHMVRKHAERNNQH